MHYLTSLSTLQAYLSNILTLMNKMAHAKQDT